MRRSISPKRPRLARRGRPRRRLPVVRKAPLRLAEDLDNRPASLRVEARGVLPGAPTVEHLPETVINVLLHLVGQGVEGPGIDQVAARVAEQPGLEIEVAEGPALRIAGAARGEVGREGRR